tara:strand:+ start:5523 stop:6074 length:552 start_codon:yes stop_codon:yes gene_type:complete
MGTNYINKKVYQEVLLEFGDCNLILEKIPHINETRSKVLSDGTKGIKETRTSYQYDFYLEDFQKQMLLKKLKKLSIKDLPDKIRILKYTEGQKFTKHRDKNSKDFSDRFKTLIIQLSHEYEYEGGDLLVYENDNVIKANKEKGSVILFNAELYHEAKEIIKGTRYVLVSWLSENDFDFKKNII